MPSDAKSNLKSQNTQTSKVKLKLTLDQALSGLKAQNEDVHGRRAFDTFRARPLASIRIASSMIPTHALRCPAFVATLCNCRTSGIHKNREFLVSHASVATPRICEFHICCARLMAPSVCCNPTDLQVPRLLRASCGARPPLLRPFRSLSAKRVLWCPWLATTHQIHVCCVPLMVPSVC